MTAGWRMWWHMEPDRNRSQPIDDLIEDALREHMGPPPSREVWRRIAQEIEQPAPRSRRRISLAALWPLPPLLQRASVGGLMLLLLGQPALEQVDRFYHAPPANRVIPTSLPSAPHARPVPQADLDAEALAALGEALPDDRLPPAKLIIVEGP